MYTLRFSDLAHRTGALARFHLPSVARYIIKIVLLTTKTVFLYLLIANPTLKAQEPEQSLLFCGDSWAPYLYKKPGGKVEDNFTPSGVDIEILQAISRETGISLKVEIVPWKRCLHNTRNYLNIRQHAAATDTTFNTERAETYYYVGPIYSAKNALFYSRKVHPNGLINPLTGQKVTKMQEVKHFTICGMAGWNYSIYTAKYGIPQKNIILTSHSGLNAVLKMLTLNRCDVFDSQISAIVGGIETGSLDFPDTVDCQRLDNKANNFYLIIAKDYPHSKQVVSEISHALIKLKESGEHQTIIDNYLSSDFPSLEQDFSHCY